MTSIRRLRRARLTNRPESAENPAMERRAKEKDWRDTDRLERRMPQPFRPGRPS